MIKQYSLDEIGLIPKSVSTIEHRKDVNPYVHSPFGIEKLPIFVSPMTCVVDENNLDLFQKSKVEPILPVFHERKCLRQDAWTALTLQEFEILFCGHKMMRTETHHVLIDCANGHMKKIYDLIKDAKDFYGEGLIVMLGNIANPYTYEECCKAGVNFIRIGIGGGSGCTTSVQTGVHTSIPWMLEKIKQIKQDLSLKGIEFRTKIVADGGVNTIGKAIKCLALGADYVMMGRIFAQCEEACGELRPAYPDIPVKERRYYGQSSERGQIDRFGHVKSNPEGTDYWIPVTTNLTAFTDHFEAALRSAMSYAGAANLEEFIGHVDYCILSEAEFRAYDK